MVTKTAIRYKIVKKLIIGSFISLFSVSAYAVPATVSYIVDGDTFSASVLLKEDIKISVRVRIRNIDTPEIHGQCQSEIDMGQKAKLRLGQLLPIGSTVELTEIKDDKYLGRIDANVISKNGLDIGEIMVKENLAHKYKGGKRKPWCEEISKK